MNIQGELLLFLTASMIIVTVRLMNKPKVFTAHIHMSSATLCTVALQSETTPLPNYVLLEMKSSV